MKNNPAYFIDRRGRIVYPAQLWTKQGNGLWVIVRKAPGQRVPQRVRGFGLPKRLTEYEARQDLARFAKRKRWRGIFVEK